MSRNIWAGRLPFFGSGQPKVAKNVRSRAKCVKPVPPRRRSPSLRRRAPADLEPPGGLQQGPAGLLGGLAPGLRDGQLPLPPVGLHAHEHQVIARQVGDLDGLAGLPAEGGHLVGPMAELRQSLDSGHAPPLLSRDRPVFPTVPHRRREKPRKGGRGIHPFIAKKG